MKSIFVVSLAALLTLGGCHSAERRPLELVIVPDISASIDPESERQMFATVEVIASHLHRGDTLTIIPITGDTEAELSGRTLHYEAPGIEKRQAYDSDLRKLANRVTDDLTHLSADAVAHPGKHTDIIGSIGAALRDFSAAQTDKRLVVLSDFIQDDKQMDFCKDARLADPQSAIKAAKDFSLNASRPFGVQIVLGRLKSSEFSRMSSKRAQAVDAFWEAVMPPAKIDPDGISALQRYNPAPAP